VDVLFAPQRMYNGIANISLMYASV